MRRKERKNKRRVETGKVFISLYGVACIVWITLCIFLDRQEQLAVTLAGTTVIALLGYFASARFGKYHEEKNKLMAASQNQEQEENEDEG
jgi:dipeptide/tripeptide permease